MTHLDHLKSCIKFAAAEKAIPMKKVFVNVQALEWAVKEIEDVSRNNTEND